MGDTLDSLLWGDEPHPEQTPDAEPTGETPATEPTEVEAPAVEPEAEHEADEEADDGVPPAPGTKQVPLAALKATQREKNDFKARAVEAETRLQERERETSDLRKQLEEARKAPPAAPAPAAQPAPATQLPNPVEDPEGYARAVRETMSNELWNERLNYSEANLRRAHQDVDQKVEWFKEAVAQNPKLGQDMRRHPDPYAFAYEQGERFNQVREISSDPAAFRARIEAEIRASLEQPTTEPAAPAAKPVPNLPSSLASARSAGERSAPAWTGPPSLDDILKG